MAKSKAKATQASKEAPRNVTSGELVNVDIQPFLTPGAILLGSIIIAVSIYFSFNGVNLGTKKITGGTTVTDTSVPDTTVGSEVATTNIDDDAVLGDISTAKVAIVEFSDYECPFCKTFHEDTFAQIKKDYIDTGKAIFVYRDFPLSFHEPKATEAANAAQCIFDQGGDEKYYAFHDKYFANTATNGAGLKAPVTLQTIAQEIGGIDMAKFNDCVANQSFKDEIAKDTSDGTASGVTGTPGFIVGVFDSEGNVDGVSIPGAQSYSVFQQTIEAQLARQ